MPEPHSSDVRPRRILVLGATGYIGTRLVPRLVQAGHRVRAAGRSLEKLRERPWAHGSAVDLVKADVRDEASLRDACGDVDAVYYLVHSMESRGKGFEDADRDAANAVARAARDAGVGRILYLGGLGEPGATLSHHLRSRHEVGKLLASTGIPTTELRAAVILGSGSASFEILRYLTDRLPLMITPRWVSTPVQPIAVRDVLAYLVGCLDAPATIGQRFDIGGPEVLTYRRLMEIYAEEARLRPRLVVPVPVLSPRLSSYWIHLITPAPAALAQPLAQGLRNPVIAQDARIRELLPRDLLTCREAIRLAMDPRQHDLEESHWTDAAGRAPAAWSYEADAKWTGGTVLSDTRSTVVGVDTDEAWAPIARIGGADGAYYANGSWHPRGSFDEPAPSSGPRRGRAYPTSLRAGDALDLWRVSDVKPGQLLRLVTDTHAPGRAILNFEIEPEAAGTRITQTAVFLPRGLAGLTYWYGLYPLHRAVFRRMLAGIAQAATHRSRATQGPRVAMSHG